MIPSISWGIRISMLYIGFALFIIFMVWRSFGENIDLVANDYYNRELEYNEQMEKTQRASKLTDKLNWKIVNSRLVLEFPGVADGGTILFQRPSDAQFDRTYNLSTSSDSILSIPLEEFTKGMYRLKADWSMSGVTYYNEQVVVIP
jgi:nitrogen fixation protein FixH